MNQARNIATKNK